MELESDRGLSGTQCRVRRKGVATRITRHAVARNTPACTGVADREQVCRDESSEQEYEPAAEPESLHTPKRPRLNGRSDGGELGPNNVRLPHLRMVARPPRSANGNHLSG